MRMTRTIGKTGHCIVWEAAWSGIVIDVFGNGLENIDDDEGKGSKERPRFFFDPSDTCFSKKNLGKTLDLKSGLS
jgi:hypothetical protein